tara:strand:- start:1017 stop:1760 length:744 start_codon:yes stop_codon:yes gene_type:complete
MEENWINIEGELLKISDLPQQLKNLNLIPIFLRRYFELKFINDIKVDKEEQILFQQKFMDKEGIKNKDELSNWLKINSISEKEISKQLYINLKLEKFKRATFDHKVEDIFLKTKKNLDRVTYSLLRVRSKTKASELFIRLSEEEATFPELASKYSEGVEQVLHGLVGPMELGKVNPNIAERLLSSSPGQLWAPFELEGWWILIRFERLIPASLNEMMRDRIINELYEISIRDKIKNILDQLNINDHK